MWSLLSLAALAADWPTPEVSSEPWTTSADGLEVQDLVVGAGALVEEGASATVNYTGMLASGEVFDSSASHGAPLTFRVGEHRVIRGWEDGLIGMRVGGRRRLVIPATLGYGMREMGPIPPGSTLYFEIELVGVVEARKAPSAPEAVVAEAWRVLPVGARWADVTVGDGKKAKAGRRVCIDLVSWRDGAVVDNTYPRSRCTWWRLDDGVLPPGLDLGIEGMKTGGVRLIEAEPEATRDPRTGDQAETSVVWRVELGDTGK